MCFLEGASRGRLSPPARSRSCVRCSASGAATDPCGLRSRRTQSLLRIYKPSVGCVTTVPVGRAHHYTCTILNVCHSMCETDINSNTIPNKR